MSTFCRHGTQVESCPICRGAVQDAQREAAGAALRRAVRRGPATSSLRPRAASAARAGRLTIRHETRSTDDGFRSTVAPGLRSSADAERLAQALAGASARIELLARDPPGLYREVANAADVEEAAWLAFEIALIGPLEDAPDPFASIDEVRTGWAGGGLPDLARAEPGPRGSLAGGRGEETLGAYRRWVERAGSQAAAFAGDASWSPAQRFERVFERLALPALERRARFDLLLTLGACGRFPLVAASLLLVDDDPVMRAAKRVFGIGDRMTLERRVRELAAASALPVGAFDLALDGWGAGATLSAGTPGAHDESALERARDALGVG
ncbi:MAG TPA: hypothetical protein VL977_06250 [Solirubrobacteraceae bacterium]|nr:hypothetical protein [Solirubrobacteraceae bacterium]